MSSGSSLQAANRALALRELKFKKTSKQSQPNGNHTPNPSAPSVPTATTYTVPAQSRDGSVHSPYFFSRPQTASGTILAPDSSPTAPAPPATINSSLSYKPHQSHFFSSSSSGQHLPTFPLPRREVDPLSAPSGFSTASSFVASGSRPSTSLSTIRPVENDEDDPGPPRKRINRGGSPSDPIRVESSPEVRKYLAPTVNRRPRVDSSDSDEGLPDPINLLPGHSKPRVFRGRRPDSEPAGSPESVELTRFIFTNPTQNKVRVITAFKVCDGDVKAATSLIHDPTWQPFESPSLSAASPPPSSSVTPSASGSGSNQRAVEKEKGKKSMIYAKRHNGVAASQLHVAPKEPVEPVESVLEILSSPVAPRPSKRKAARQRVDSSASEAEYSEDGYDSDVKGGVFAQSREDEYYQVLAVRRFNDCEHAALVELAGVTLQQADTLISLRPFTDASDLKSKLARRNKTGLSPRILDYCTEIFKGYKNVDDVLEGCERVGEQLRKAISRWSNPSGLTSKESTPLDDGDGALALDSLPVGGPVGTDDGYIDKQPSLLADTVELKEYQLLGVNWLNLLYSRDLSCILADEMGLGKTVQVIAFLAHLKEQGQQGPHLIIVPSSTLENWIREFDRFAPSIEVQAYYGAQKDRIELRNDLRAQNWNVLITTYNLAQGDERDRKFFRKFDWQCCIFDEGHVLKNFDSQRYTNLMKIDSKWRLLLTGTPLQNNLQELVSLMNFILPRYFADVISNLRAIFKVKADKHISLLSRDRVSRAKKMMTPFVLRRRKDTVLKDLPKKTERIEWCEMTALQKSIYRGALQRSRKAVLEATASLSPSDSDQVNGKGKKRPREMKKFKDTSTNVLMDLRKAASHPMLFRRLFDDSVIKVMARQCMKEPEFSSSNYSYIVEDMEVMTDAELQVFSLKYKSTRKFAKEADCFLDAGKVSKLLSLLNQYDQESRRVLIFSQFTQILDILQAVLRHRKTKYLLLTGSTAVDVRQSLVDEFNEDESIPVFLLSTKAGGMGINLTAASVVVLFDQDFNPHNDRQAADRAYRIGQKRNVEVIKLITRSTIEEDMYRLGQTKLALDEAVAGEDSADGDGAEKAEKTMRTSLLSVLREQFEKEEQRKGNGANTPATNDTTDMDIEGGDSDVILVE